MLTHDIFVVAVWFSPVCACRGASQRCARTTRYARARLVYRCGLLWGYAALCVLGPARRWPPCGLPLLCVCTRAANSPPTFFSARRTRARALSPALQCRGRRSLGAGIPAARMHRVWLYGGALAGGGSFPIPTQYRRLFLDSGDCPCLCRVSAVGASCALQVNDVHPPAPNRATADHPSWLAS